MSAIIGGFAGYIVATEYVTNDVTIWALTLACGLGALLLYWYSPFPASNGGMGSGSPKWQTWGFRYGGDREKAHSGGGE